MLIVVTEPKLSPFASLKIQCSPTLFAYRTSTDKTNFGVVSRFSALYHLGPQSPSMNLVSPICTLNKMLFFIIANLAAKQPRQAPGNFGEVWALKVHVNSTHISEKKRLNTVTTCCQAKSPSHIGNTLQKISVLQVLPALDENKNAHVVLALNFPLDNLLVSIDLDVGLRGHMRCAFPS